MTSHYKTGTHPFYIGMYIHIYTHIYVHIYTSQKECLHIFTNLRIVRDRKKDITGGGKRLILTPRGFEKKSSLKSACAQSREISARAGLDPQ